MSAFYGATGGDDRTRILEERARRLARPLQPANTGPSIEILCFDAGAERYAIATEFVHRVVRAAPVARLPNAPACFSGIANFGGEVLPVIDLGTVLDTPIVRRAAAPWLLVLGRERPEFAIAVEAADDVLTVPVASIVAPPDATGGSRTLLGVLNDARTVLSGTALLDDPRLCVESETTSRQAPREKA